MKICPKCQQQFPNGFEYCPTDTEQLITNEEYIRRTKPLAATPVEPIAPIKESAEVPIVEVVPINNPSSKEIIEPPVAAKAVYRVTEPVGREKEPAVFRPSEAARAQQEAPKTTNKPSQASSQAAPTPKAFASSGGTGSSTSDFGFSIPEAPSLLSRLTAGLQNIGEAFKKSDYKANGDFQFLLQEESLGERIGRELGAAWTDLRRDPQKFAVDFVRGEGTNHFRRNAFLAGFEMVIFGVVTVIIFDIGNSILKKAFVAWTKPLVLTFMLYLLACYLTRCFLLVKLVRRASNKLAAAKVSLEFANWTPPIALLLLAILLSNYNFYCRIFPGRCVAPEVTEEEKLSDITMVDLAKIDVKLPESSKAKEKMIGGSKSQPKPASGGGGGGRNQPTPPSKGNPPQMALTPQIIPPSPDPPKIKNPTLVVASTIYGDPKAMPPLKGPIGDPTGIPVPPSSGPGQGAGIGRGSGTGVGGGQGGGAGPGRGGNTGGGDMGIGGGSSIQPMTASLRPNILYKEKAQYTEEARTNKITGTVVLSMVFNLNGTITDIRTVRGLPDGLTEKAIEAAKRIRFTPAVKNGQPVAVRGQIEFNFMLY